MFWAGEKLKDALRDLIVDFDEGRCDRATYRLRVGPEVYTSPTGLPDDPRSKTKIQLGPDEGFTIPAGQFALLLTEERVEVPYHALAFISMRARYKFRGLVNVSGFHVDPGFKGRLIFAVFNAGPGPVHLARGEECFHIWYASLADASPFPIKPGYETIPSEIINPIAGEIQSFAGLDAKISENDKKLTDRIVSMEREQALIRWAAALVIGALVTIGLRDNSKQTGNSPANQAVAPAAALRDAPTAPAPSQVQSPSTTPAVQQKGPQSTKSE